VVHHPGDRCLIHGLRDDIPPVQEIIEKPTLEENEGIYVKDVKSGHFRAHIGSSFILTEAEELWKKELPEVVEELLAKEITVPGMIDRAIKLELWSIKHHNSHDYKENQYGVLI